MGEVFLSGLVVGLLLGFVGGPILRSWLIWREASGSRRQERLAEALLTRLEEPGDPMDDRRPR